ncbi:MAG: hypothetical protein H6594_10220 [Flavobacteriales bacterium]|nr:hypothetical protein [Flavobacteriales bacterium]
MNSMERFKNGDIPTNRDFVIGTTDNGGLNIGEDTTSVSRAACSSMR